MSYSHIHCKFVAKMHHQIRAVRYHPEYAYHDTIALVSRIDTSMIWHNQVNVPVKFGLHHLAGDDVH